MMRKMVVRACSGELGAADGGEMVMENSMDFVRVSGPFCFTRHKQLKMRTAAVSLGTRGSRSPAAK